MTLKLGTRKPAMEAATFCSHLRSSPKPRPKWMMKKVRIMIASANQDTIERSGEDLVRHPFWIKYIQGGWYLWLDSWVRCDT